MALWKYTLERPDGEREERMLAAGNRDAARERAKAHAAALNARLVGDVEVTDARRGSM